FGTARKRDLRRRLADRKLPDIAGDVPVKLVVIFEKSDLTCRVVSDLVSIDARCQPHIAITDANTQDAGTAFGGERLRPAITQHRNDIEPHLAYLSLRIVIAQGNIPEYSPRNTRAFSVDGDFLRHRQRTVRMHVNIGVEGAYLLSRTGRRGKAQDDECGCNQQARKKGHSQPSAQLKETCGTIRSCGLSISKYSALVKPKLLATIDRKSVV